MEGVDLYLKGKLRFRWNQRHTEVCILSGMKRLRSWWTLSRNVRVWFYRSLLISASWKTTDGMMFS